LENSFFQKTLQHNWAPEKLHQSYLETNRGSLLKTVFFLENQATTQNVFLKHISGITHKTSHSFKETKAQWFEQLKERNELPATESIEFTC
jgi:hypothetical protein